MKITETSFGSEISTIEQHTRSCRLSLAAISAATTLDSSSKNDGSPAARSTISVAPSVGRNVTGKRRDSLSCSPDSVVEPSSTSIKFKGMYPDSRSSLIASVMIYVISATLSSDKVISGLSKSNVNEMSSWNSSGSGFVICNVSSGTTAALDCCDTRRTYPLDCLSSLPLAPVTS